MSNLSPQSQTVLDAIYEIKDPMGEDGAVLAAALRAVVRNNIYNDDYGNEYINANDILRIANELDNL